MDYVTVWTLVILALISLMVAGFFVIRCLTQGRSCGRMSYKQSKIFFYAFKYSPYTVVHATIRVGTLIIWRGASHMWYVSKDFLGFIHSVPKGNIVGNLWFGYNCQFYTQKTQNWENLVISGLFQWHKFTLYSAIYCFYWSKITNLSWNFIK